MAVPLTGGLSCRGVRNQNDRRGSGVLGAARHAELWNGAAWITSAARAAAKLAVALPLTHACLPREDALRPRDCSTLSRGGATSGLPNTKAAGDFEDEVPGAFGHKSHGGERRTASGVPGRASSPCEAVDVGLTCGVNGHRPSDSSTGLAKLSVSVL